MQDLENNVQWLIKLSNKEKIITQYKWWLGGLFEQKCLFTCITQTVNQTPPLNLKCSQVVGGIIAVPVHVSICQYNWVGGGEEESIRKSGWGLFGDQRDFVNNFLWFIQRRIYLKAQTCNTAHR